MIGRSLRVRSRVINLNLSQYMTRRSSPVKRKHGAPSPSESLTPAKRRNLGASTSSRITNSPESEYLFRCLPILSRLYKYSQGDDEADPFVHYEMSEGKSP